MFDLQNVDLTYSQHSKHILAFFLYLSILFILNTLFTPSVVILKFSGEVVVPLCTLSQLLLYKLLLHL